MIPVLDAKTHRPIPNRFKETLADRELPKYDYDLAIIIFDDKGNEITVPVWRFIERYLRVKDKNGHILAFEINPAQVQLYKELCEMKRAGKPMRVNILKARQLGFSTFIAAIIFVLTILVPNQTACIIADIADHATNLFDKYKFYYEVLPQFIKSKLPKKKSNAKELVVDYGEGQESKVRILVQGDNAGRSDTCQYLHLSEVAFWDDIEGTTTSVLQTVDDTNPNSIIAYETTANGVNYYKTIWDQDVGTSGGYKALFFPWYLDPHYSMPYDGYELEDWEIKLKDKLKLSLDQMMWYHVQLIKMRNNLSKLRQEFPSTPIEAFIVSGTNKFNMELVQQRKEEIFNKPPIMTGFFSFRKEVSRDGEAINISNIKFIESDTCDDIKIYELPEAGHPYVSTNDPANGGEDYFATNVFNNYTGHQCAVYHKNKCDADECAYQTYCLIKMYEDKSGVPVLATGETNTTSRILKLLYKCGHHFIYQDQDYDALSGRFQDQFGYKTKQNNRLVMIDEFAEGFRDNPEIINDWNTINEMENFQVVKNESTQKEKVQAVSGTHDDLVMSICGFFLCRHRQIAIPQVVLNPSKCNSVDELEARVMANRRNQQPERRVYQVWD